MRVAGLLLVLLAAPLLAGEPVEDPLTQEVERLVARLGADDFAVRQQAYRSLKALGPRSVMCLTRYLHHPDPEVARLVGQLVKGYREEQQGALLAPLASEESDFEDSKAMARILARGRAILPALYTVLDEEDAQYPRYSYWRMRNTYTAIGALARDEDLDRLLSRLEHPNIQHRVMLRPILESLTRKVVIGRIRKLLGDPKANGRVRARLIELCRNSSMTREEKWLPPLVAKLIDDPDAEVREAAVGWFSVRQDPAMLGRILERCADQAPRVRSAAFRALRLYRVPEAARALRVGLGDPVGEVRVAALETLRSVSGPEIAPEIRPFLKDPDPVVRAQAARALGAMKDQGSLPALIELLASRDEEFLTYTLHAVVEALANLESPAALPPLEKLLKDARSNRRIETYRYHILTALVRIGGEKVLPEVRLHLADPTLQNGHIVLEAIARIPSEKVIPILLDALENGDTRYRTAAVRGLWERGYRKAAPLIEKAMEEEEDAWFLSEALRAVTGFGESPGEKTVSRLLSFDSADVRNMNLIHTAIRAASRFSLRRLAPKIGELMEAYPDRYAYRAVDALGRLGDPSVIPALKKQLAREKYASTRYRIALALARLGDAAALESRLGELRRDRDPPSLATLAEALQALGRGDEAREAIRAALKGGADANTLYDLGCVLSLLGDRDEAFRMLWQAASGRPLNRRHLEQDADLDPIRDDPRFAEFEKQAK